MAELTPVPSRHLDELQRDPHVATYRQVLIDPVAVALRKDWPGNAYNRAAPRALYADAGRRIAERTAASLEASLAQAFRARGYEIVQAPGPGVLRLAARVEDLYVNAPEALSPWPARSFTREAGEAMLRLDARDAASGALVARVAHKATARQLGRLEHATDVSNQFWLEAVFGRWAAQCAQALKS